MNNIIFKSNLNSYIMCTYSFICQYFVLKNCFLSINHWNRKPKKWRKMLSEVTLRVTWRRHQEQQKINQEELLYSIYVIVYINCKMRIGKFIYFRSFLIKANFSVQWLFYIKYKGINFQKDVIIIIFLLLWLYIDRQIHLTLIEEDTCMKFM